MGTSSDRVRRAVDAYIDYLRKKTETLLLLLLYRGRQLLGRTRARLFFLKDSRESLSLMKHEQGHGLQNIYWGVLMPFVITIPSAIRYWYRRALTARGRIDLVPYSAIWFEADADRRGAELYEYLTETRNRVNSTS